MSLRPRLAAMALIVVTAAACSSHSGTATPEGDSATSSSSAETTSVAAEFTATTDQLSGVRDRATYDITIPQVEGGDPAVSARFNAGVRTYVDDQIGQDQDGSFTLTGTSQKVVLGDAVIAGVLKMEFMATDPMGAHPYGLVGTWVIRKSNAEPVMLTELFTDENAGLTRLAEVADLKVRQQIGDAVFQSGLAPEAKNYANWVPTAAGIEVHFDDGQVGPHAAGMVTIVVPWADLDGVLSEKLY